VVYIGTVATQHAQADPVSKVFGFAHSAQGSVVAGRAIGGTVAGTGQAGVGSRAFYEWSGLFTVWNVPVIVWDDPVALHDLHGGPTGICVAHCTRRARFARPFVSRSHVMQVLLANFASAPRWVSTRRCFAVGRRADWADGTRDLTLDVLKKSKLASGTKTGV
jgi:hypothetical protein